MVQPANRPTMPPNGAIDSTPLPMQPATVTATDSTLEQALRCEPGFDCIPDEAPFPPQDGALPAPAAGRATPVLSIAGAGTQPDPVGLINHANHDVTLFTMHLPDRTMADALDRAAAKGRRVEVRLPPAQADRENLGDQSRIRELERNGVRVTYGHAPTGLQTPPDSQGPAGKLWVDRRR